MVSRVIFVNRFYAPDQSATSQMLTDLAEFLAGRGWNTLVLTSSALYSDPTAVLSRSETLLGVTVRRAAITRFGRGTLPGRVADYLTFYVSAVTDLLGMVGRGDLVVAKTDPPLISVLCAAICRLKGARLVNWLQDLYPEVAAAHGVRLASGSVAWPLRAFRNWSLRVAEATVAISPAMAERAIGAGAHPGRVHVVENWADDEAITPLAAEMNPLRTSWGLSDNFVVGYSGNLGRAHEFETLLGAAERLRDHPGLRFLFIGGGHNSGPLAEAVEARGLQARFVFKPYQDRSLLAQSLCVPDLHWVSLRPEFEGLIFPSKVYGVAAAGRGLVVVGDRQGEMAQMVERHGCGVAVEIGDVDKLTNDLAALADDAARVLAMGGRARAMIDSQATKRSAFERWAAIIESLETNSAKP